MTPRSAEGIVPAPGTRSSKTEEAYSEIEAGEILPDEQGDIKTFGVLSGLNLAIA